MRAPLLTIAFSINLLAAGQELNVAICNQGGLSESVVSQAKSELEFVYRSAGVHIVWRECDTFPAPDTKEGASWFIIRLLNGKPPRMVGPASLDVMGKAFVGEHGGYLADAYFQAVQATSEKHHVDAAVLLGFVMAHELGHLILGAGHTPDGVMQAVWGQRQMDALQKRWLKFNEEGAARIRHALEAGSGSTDAGAK